MHPTSPPHFLILNLKEFCYLCKIPIVLTLFLLKISSILMTKQHKSLFVSIALAVTSLSISLNTSAQQTANAAVPFTLSGQIQGAAEGDTVILARRVAGRANSLMPIDTAFVHAQHFAFHSAVEGAQLLWLVALDNNEPISIGEVVVDGTSFSVSMPRNINEGITIKGSEANALWQGIQRKDAEFAEAMKPHIDVFRNQALPQTDRDAAKISLDSLATLRMRHIVSFITVNSTTKVADLVFQLYYPLLNQDDMQLVCQVLAQNNPPMPGFRSVLEQMEQSRIQSQLGKGGDYIDFSCPNRQGQTVKLSDIVTKNKYTLLDFWASWCGPCRAEMPTVKQAYDLYHSKGLEVVGVSLDNTAQAWERAINSLNLNWIHLSDLKGWQCAPAQLYGVHSIPSSFLIRQDGTVMARDLRGQNLLKVLEQLLP